MLTKEILAEGGVTSPIPNSCGLSVPSNQTHCLSCVALIRTTTWHTSLQVVAEQVRHVVFRLPTHMSELVLYYYEADVMRLLAIHVAS